MPRTLPTTVVQAMNAQTSTALMLWLLTITHANIATVRMVNNTQAVTSNGETFDAMPFSIVMPPDDPEAPPMFRLQIENVTREIGQRVRAVAGSRDRALATIQLVEFGDPDTVLESATDYEVRDPSYNASVVTMKLTPTLFFGLRFPRGQFLPSNFPGLH